MKFSKINFPFSLNFYSTSNNKISGTTVDNTNNTNNILIYKNFMEDGTDIKWEDTTEFKFPIKGGRVIKVYDGDSLTIASKLSQSDSELYRFSVRLNGVDTPEMKGKDVTEEEKDAAKNARDFVANLVLNKFVRL